MQLLDCLLIISKILFATDKNDGESLAEMKDFGDPLEKGISNETWMRQTVVDGYTFS